MAQSATPANRVFDAAVNAFASWGFHGTTTRQIADGAGVSRGAVYLYYPSKETLLFEICKTGHTEVIAMLHELAAAGNSPTDRVKAMTHYIVLDHAHNHLRARVAHGELSALTEEHFKEVAELRQGITELMRCVIDEGIAQGDFVAYNPQLTCLAILSLSIDVCRWYQEDGVWTADEIASALSDLALKMLTR